jgi:threonine/homoserine/homoserine lactone efflux protein
MERAVQIFAVVQFLIIGLSHIVRPRAWSEFFLLLRSKGVAGGFANGFLSLWAGSIIVAFHPVWSGIPLILTVLGWAQVLKSLLIFVVPGYAEKSLEKAPIDRPWVFIVPGVLFVLIGCLLLYHLMVS